MKVEHYRNAEYAYSEVFWGKDQNREYEHNADKLLLDTAIHGKSDLIVDLGGGFGRLVPILKKKSAHILIVDASMDLLREAQATYGTDPSVHYIRANAYHLPFAPASLERVVCLRMMHHIGQPDSFFKELNRVVAKNVYLEFPNKRHFLQYIRFFFMKDQSIDVLSSRPEIRNGLFYNFALTYMKNHILRETIFSIERTSGGSFFRNKQAKKVPLKVLLTIENILQRIQSLAATAPSIMLTLTKKSHTEKEVHFTDIESRLVCPECKGEFVHTSAELLSCAQGHSYEKRDGIWDLFFEELGVVPDNLEV